MHNESNGSLPLSGTQLAALAINHDAISCTVTMSPFVAKVCLLACAVLLAGAHAHAPV